MPVLSSSRTSTSPRRLDRAARQREHVAAHEAVHAGDADRRQQRADRRRDERDEQRDERRDRRRRCPRTSANGRSVTTTTRKISVSPPSRMPSAISLGVLRRSAPSTSAIMRSRKLWPGSWVISTTIRSDSTRVPPVTALRSPPASRMTGADSPVIADSSTDAIPSMTVPSPGMTSPASTTTTSPRRRSRRRPRACRRAASPSVSVRIARSVAACALPRPSASASARLAKRTVSHSHSATVNVYHAGLVAAAERLAAEGLDEPADGRDDRADLDDEHHRVADLDARVELAQRGEQRGAQDRRVDSSERCAVVIGRASWSSARLSSRTLTPGSPSTPSERPSVLSSTSALDARRAAMPRTRGDAARLDRGVRGGDVRVDARGRRLDRVDRDVAALQAGVVGPSQREVRASRFVGEQVAQVRAVRAEVVEERAGRVVARHRRAALEVARVAA